MASETPTATVNCQWTQRRRIGLLICLAVSAGTGLALLLERSGRQSYPGSLEGRKTIVTTNCAAKVHQISVKMGQSVAYGDPLVQLIDSSLEDRLVAKRREIAEFEAEVIRSKAIADVELVWRRRDLQAEIFETQLKLAGLSQERLNKQVEQIAWKERLSSTEANYGPLIAGMNHQFRVEAHDVRVPDDRKLQAMLREDSAAATVEALTTQIALCERRLKNLEILDKELDGKIRASSGVDIAEARYAGAKQELVALENQVKELTMTSPTYGTIGDVKLQSGDWVPNGTTLVEILDNQQSHVVAQIPSGAASKVHTGSKVTLIFPMNERRTGVVTSVPPQTVSMTGTSESVLPIKIEPAGKLWPKLAIGSNVNVVLH